MDESFAMLAIGPFEVKFTPFSRRAVMQDTGCSGLRVPFVSIHGDLLFRPLDIVGRNYQFLRKRIVGEIGIPYGTFLSQEALIQAAFKIFNGDNVLVIRTGSMHHVKRIQVILLQDIANVLQSLRIAGLFLLFCGVLPLLTQNDGLFMVQRHIPSAENYHLFVMVDKRPAPGPVPAGSTMALDKLFSIQVSPQERFCTSVRM